MERKLKKWAKRGSALVSCVMMILAASPIIAEA